MSKAVSRVVNERVAALLAILLVGVALYVSSFRQDFTDAGLAHSPMFFPRIILILWIGLAAIAVAQAIFAQEASGRIDGITRLAVLVVAALVYTNVMTTYGFFLTSAGFAAICLPVFGIRNPAVILAYAVAVPGSLVILFNHILGMPLPTSPFTFLF
jgi:hypothetical protein